MELIESIGNLGFGDKKYSHLAHQPMPNTNTENQVTKQSSNTAGFSSSPVHCVLSRTCRIQASNQMKRGRFRTFRLYPEATSRHKRSIRKRLTLHSSLTGFLGFVDLSFCCGWNLGELAGLNSRRCESDGG